MKSGMYKIVPRAHDESGKIILDNEIGTFHVFADTAYSVSSDLAESLSRLDLEEILRVYGNSPYFVIKKTN